MSIRSKFRLTQIVEKTDTPTYKSTTLIFTTQYDPTIPEDQRFCKATPTGRIEMIVDNPVALAFFKVGKDYYFDATPVVVAA